MTSWLHPPKIQWPVIRKSSVVPKSWEIVFSAPPLEIGRVKRTITEWSHQQFSLDQHREPYGSIVKAQLVVLHSQDQITLQLRNSTSRTLRSSLIDSLRDGLPNLTSNCNSSTMMVTVTEVTRWNGTKKCTWKVTGSNRNEVKASLELLMLGRDTEKPEPVREEPMLDNRVESDQTGKIVINLIQRGNAEPILKMSGTEEPPTKKAKEPSIPSPSTSSGMSSDADKTPKRQILESQTTETGTI